jgi:dihydrofolate reductase
MPSPLVRLYIAVSLDGFIATPNGGVEWLEPYPAQDFGFAKFLESIGTIVMGRATYDQALGFGPWAYEGKRTIVLTSRPLDDPPPGVEARDGDVTSLTADLKASSAGDIWLLGGAKSAGPFLEGGLVDRLELFVIPVLLGEGIALFDGANRRTQLQLESATPYPRGVVQLVYSCRLAD